MQSGLWISPLLSTAAVYNALVWVSLQENYAENDFQIEFNPSAVLAFVPARSCHSQLSGDHGTFSPPVFYGNIDVHLWCNWTVLAAPGKHIVIYITGFRTNESCRDNLDEIIFEGISSSVETSIVYACWNKHTHVFATEASAVNVVLLWRSFSNISSKRYFEGRYYIFDDPVLGPSSESGNCSLTNRQNISTSEVIQGSYPDKRLKNESHLYSVFPESSSSKRFKSSIHHYSQGPPTVVETYSPTYTINHLPTTTTAEDDLLPVTQTLVQNLSTIDNKFKPQLPVLTQSMDLSVYKGHTVQPTAEDLEPSQVAKLETDGKMSHSEFVSETPNLISTHSTELLKVDQHSAVLAHSLVTSIAELKYVSTIHVVQMSPYSSPTRLQETPQVNTTHTVVFHETLYVGKSNVFENQHLSKEDFEPPGDFQFITTLAPDAPESSLVHIFHTDFPEPSLSSDLTHSSKIHTTKTSHLIMDQTSEHISMPSFNVTQAFSKTLNVSVISSIEFQETVSLRLTEYFEPTVLNVSTVQLVDLVEVKPLYVTDITTLSEVPKSVTNKMVHTVVGQSVGLNTTKSAHLLMLSIRIESNPKEPVSEYTWQVASSHPTLHPDSLNKSQLQSTSFTEGHTSVLHGQFFPLQVSEQPFLPNYESALQPPITTTKTLNNVIAGKTEMADPEQLESYTSLIPTSSTASPISSPKILTSVLDFQIVHPTYWITVEQPQDPVTPKSTVVIPDQQLMLESTLASHPIPEVPTEFIYSRSTPPNTEKMDKMAPNLQKLWTGGQ
ncbi:uncharacterized protein LOC130361074 [Hyla sarda]|uniref:uncharacterized protein LOC130361074 n=1 Tax=Hyla sarda TaxID=327740 RepID=UPI0024C39FC9|nr:uncharacterized protein LOC130361074 [Hyla sarda]